jgi:hypothetical protein
MADKIHDCITRAAVMEVIVVDLTARGVERSAAAPGSGMTAAAVKRRSAGAGNSWTTGGSERDFLGGFGRAPRTDIPARHGSHYGGARQTIASDTRAPLSGQACADRCLNSAPWRFTKSRMFIGLSPVSLHKLSVIWS